MITASLNNYRQSPRKVRLVADFVRGKKVERALTTLSFFSKAAASPVKSVIESAVANASENFKVAKDKLFVKEIRVDAGPTLKRLMPRARGTANRIKKRTSRITVVLDEQNDLSKANEAVS
ncbi:MAG: 50S ribosomal protein L22 [Patescibacteria group bacterium]